MDDLIWILTQPHNHNEVSIEDLLWPLQEPNNHSESECH